MKDMQYLSSAPSCATHLRARRLSRRVGGSMCLSSGMLQFSLGYRSVSSSMQSSVQIATPGLAVGVEWKSRLGTGKGGHWREAVALNGWENEPWTKRLWVRIPAWVFIACVTVGSLLLAGVTFHFPVNKGEVIISTSEVCSEEENGQEPPK